MHDAAGLAGPLAPVDVRGRVQAADLVVAGKFGAFAPADLPVTLIVAGADPRDDEAVEAGFHVSRTLKGDAGPEDLRVAGLRGRTANRQWAPLAEQQYLVVFLRPLGSRWTLVRPDAAPLRTLPDLPAPRSADPVENIARELEGVIRNAGMGPDRSLLVQAAVARADLALPIDVSVLRQRPFADPLRKAAWLAVALAAGQAEALRSLIPLLSTGDRALDPLLVLLVPAISELDDPAAFDDLTVLAHGANDDIAWAAAVALRGLDHPGVTAVLRGLLDSPRQRVRFQAVMGLAERHPEVENGGPSLPLYLEDEQRYLDLWRHWSPDRPDGREDPHPNRDK